MKSRRTGLQMILSVLILIGFLIPAQAAYAATLKVCPSGCTYATIKAAVAAAGAGDTITIGTGTYHERNIPITKDLTLTGDGSASVIIDGQSLGRIFVIGAGKVVSMSGMTIQNGKVATADQDGGAVLNNGALTLNDMKFLNNYTDNMGGAIYSASDLTISNSTFDGNKVNTARTTGASGGAIAIETHGSLSVTRSKFTNNKAMDGGAIATVSYGYFAGKTFKVSNSTFSTNTVVQQGGGLFVEQMDTTISNSVINDNKANHSFGGGLIFSDPAGNSTLTIQNVTFSHNQALNGGGLLIDHVKTATLNAVTITLNASTDTVGGGGGGINAAPSISLFIENSIIAGNTDAVGGTDHPDCFISAVSVTYSLIQNTTGCQAYNFTNNVTGVSAKLDALANYGGPTFTHRLQIGSPAIDAADNTTCPATDQRNVTRPQDGNNDGTATCDMGAYEADVAASFSSNAAQDGWVLESTENSSVGGTMNSAAATFNVGDSAAKQQYVGILSFSTGAALPDNAVVTGVTLKVKQHAIAGGGDPVTIFQGFMVDIKNGVFGAAALQTGDFATAADKTYGPFATALSGGWYSIDLAAAKTYVNKLATNSGLTQIRLRFKLDDNNDAIANYLSLSSGDAPAGSQPQLVVTYYVP